MAKAGLHCCAHTHTHTNRLPPAAYMWCSKQAGTGCCASGSRRWRVRGGEGTGIQQSRGAVRCVDAPGKLGKPPGVRLVISSKSRGACQPPVQQAAEEKRKRSRRLAAPGEGRGYEPLIVSKLQTGEPSLSKAERNRAKERGACQALAESWEPKVRGSVVTRLQPGLSWCWAHCRRRRQSRRQRAQWYR